MQNIMSYTVSKHAVLGLTRAAAVDHGHQKIRVNSVCPATVDTPFIAPGKAANPKSTSAEDMNVFSRLVLPEEVADVCIFLSSCRSSYMSGASAVVDAALSVTARYENRMARD
jgi:NAD(P)-dependent dehydrogenase (short-subunit alcohol dehydrogenase family)